MFTRNILTLLLVPLVGVTLAGCSEDDPNPADGDDGGTMDGDDATDSDGSGSDGADDGEVDGSDGEMGSGDDTGGTDESDDGNESSEGSGGDDSGDDTEEDSGADSESGESSDGAEDSSDSGDGGDGDDWVEDVQIAVHEEVNTILVVTWTQVQEADEVWLEFTFENDEILTSRPQPGQTGAHRDVVLGVPGDTDVTIRIVSSSGGTDYTTSDYQGTTDPVPDGMPEPTIVSYDPDLSTSERYLFGSVEDSIGGSQSSYYSSTFWVYIMDRQGRIVWYHADPSTNPSSAFQRVARDGEYIWIEEGRTSNGTVIKMTLDWEYYEEIPLSIRDCIDVTDDGSLVYQAGDDLYEMTPDQESRLIWACEDTFGGGFECYSNTVNWNPLDDTVILSFPGERTVIEVARQDGEVIGVYGEADTPYTYAFSPNTWGFGYQHFPNITAEGNLIVSSHMPGYEDTREPVAGQHAFVEFVIDRNSQTLVEEWYYNDGPEWPMWKGMAMRLENGNTLGNYGTGGTIREVTPDMQTAFHVKFDVPSGDDFYNKMVGHNVFVDDLYSLNGGGPD